MKILICGGRNFGKIPEFPEDTEEYKKLYIQRVKEYYGGLAYLDIKFMKQISWNTPIEIISGHAPGADSLGEDWGIIHDFKIHQFPAEWKKYGKQAGYIRNALMLKEGQPNLVVAFPGGPGTEMMMDLARKKNVQVIKVSFNELTTTPIRSPYGFVTP